MLAQERLTELLRKTTFVHKLFALENEKGKAPGLRLWGVCCFVFGSLHVRLSYPGAAFGHIPEFTGVIAQLL